MVYGLETQGHAHVYSLKIFKSGSKHARGKKMTYHCLIYLRKDSPAQQILSAATNNSRTPYSLPVCYRNAEINYQHFRRIF